MTGVHLVETREKAKEWELWAKKAVGFDQRESWALNDIRAMFFSSDGVTFTVTGDHGRVDLVTKNMRVTGNVVTRSSNGYVFQTDNVEYRSDKRILESATKVFMAGPKDRQGERLKLTGLKMVTDLTDSLMKVFDEVRGQKKTKDEKVISVQSEQAEFSGRSQQARFLKNVKVGLGPMSLTGPEVEFNFDQDAGQFTTMAVSGGVKVKDKDKQATAEKLHVDLSKNKFVFTGNPKVIQDDDELQGDEIVFLDGGQSVRINKARAKMGADRLESGY